MSHWEACLLLEGAKTLADVEAVRTKAKAGMSEDSFESFSEALEMQRQSMQARGITQ